MSDHFEPGRYWAVVTINGVRDGNATIGYDEIMETYFFQSGLEDSETETPVLWLGKSYRELASFDALKTTMGMAGAELIEWELG